MKWLEKEINLLKSLNNKIIDNNELLSLFKNRSIISIKKKSKKLKLKISTPRNNQWTSKDLEILKKYKNKDELLKLLNKNWDSILRKANQLNIKIHNNFWNKKELIFLKENYYNKDKNFLLSNINRSWDAIKQKAEELKLKRNNDFLRKSKMNKLFENNINSFYWMGFLLADGYFDLKNKRIFLTLSNKDINHLKLFESFIETNIYKYNKNCRISFQNIDIFNKIIKKFHIYNSNKTYNPIDFYLFNFKNEYLLSLIIGFIDGDGSITKLKNRKDCNLRIKLHSSWLKNLIFIENFIYDYFQINKDKTFSKINKNNYSYLCVSNNKILKLLKNEILILNIPFMERKWNKI